jgi:hypothetical protein
MTRSPLDGKHGSPHPSSLRKGDEGHNAKSRTRPDHPHPGQGSGAPRTATPSECVSRLQKSMKGRPPSKMRKTLQSLLWIGPTPPRTRRLPMPAETLSKPAERNTSQACHSTFVKPCMSAHTPQDFGGYTRGCASTPPQKPHTLKGKVLHEVTSLCKTNHHFGKGSGATVRDGHKGSPN